MPEQRVALVDCNNFYASCERLFAPHLEGRPLIVLSNNDGCAVARSNEAKALGIPMGAPFHTLRDLIRRHDIAVFSSNYALYGDLSARVMQTLEMAVPRMEIYSIDEAFLDLTGFSRIDPDPFCRDLRRQVRRATGIPVSIGIAPTRTLAKAANRVAKKSPHSGGVLDITDPSVREHTLAGLAVGDIWGVGPRWANRLEAEGIRTAVQLRDARPAWVRQRFGVVLERTLLELRGIPAIDWETAPPPPQSITCSRSFGQKITDAAQLREAVAHYTARAAERLRRRRMLARTLLVFIAASRFSGRDRPCHDTLSITLPEATDDTIRLTGQALRGVTAVHRPGFRYHRAGVLLLDLVPERGHQPSLFGDATDRSRSERLMRTVDDLNRRLGGGTVRLGAEGLRPAWGARQERKSPAYTTNWQELPVVRAA